jgi:outer membrane protein assembly factor BamD
MSSFNLFSKFGSFFALAMVLTLLSGCGTTKEKTYSASQLFQQGKRLAKEKETEEAKAKIQLLLEDYPDSKERTAATMLLADLHYSGEEYEEAKFHYQKFIELYPVHRFVDRAHFYKAMSSFKLTDLASRDLTPVNSALEGFERFAKDFPKSSYTKKANGKITQCLDILAQNIFEIGKFYYRTGSYQSAILRLKRLKEEYPKHAYILEAEFLLGEAYYHEQNFPVASGYYKTVIKNSPRSEFAKEARLRLKAMR